LICKWSDNQEIPDPYRKNVEAFASASALIESGLDAWQQKIWK
jgi:protein-tyrosine-phosphatase